MLLYRHPRVQGRKTDGRTRLRTQRADQVRQTTQASAQRGAEGLGMYTLQPHMAGKVWRSLWFGEDVGRSRNPKRTEGALWRTGIYVKTKLAQGLN